MRETVKVGTKTVHLIGTAHISQKSADEVLESINELQPDNVCVELCPSRHKQLTEENKWKNMDIVKVIKSGNAGMLFTSLLLSSFQKKMGEQLGVRPGQEMITALAAAEENGIQSSLVDREVNITIKRAWRGMSYWERMKILSQLVLSVFYTEQVDEAEVENLKNVDIITAMLDDFGTAFPNIKKYLIDERDQYMAKMIKNAPGENIIVVVGAGHMKGIKAELEKEQDLQELNSVPPKGNLGTYLKWGLPALIIGLFILGILQGGAESSREMIEVWVISHSLLSGIGCLLAGGSLLSVLTAVVVSPFTSLNPLIAAGWVSGLVEAYIRKPRVSDFEELSNLTLSYANLKSNAVSRILMVLMLTNLGNAMATWISGGWFVSILN